MFAPSLRFFEFMLFCYWKCFSSDCLDRSQEGIAVGRSLALIKNEQIDGNKEMIAFGIMNIAGSCTSCYLTTGPFSKSAVNFHAGCRTPMSNVVMSVCIMLVLLFLAPLFKYTPLVALSSIIVVAMIGLIKVKEFLHLYRVDKFDFCICMVAFVGVVFFTMVIGLGASVSTPWLLQLLCLVTGAKSLCAMLMRGFARTVHGADRLVSDQSTAARGEADHLQARKHGGRRDLLRRQALPAREEHPQRSRAAAGISHLFRQRGLLA